MWGKKSDTSATQIYVLRFLFLEIVCVVLMILDNSNKIATPIRSTISALTLPLVKVVEWPQRAYNFINSALSDHLQLLQENSDLKQNLSQVQIDLLQMEVISQQNVELRQLLNAKQQLPLQTTAAFLVNLNIGKNQHRIVINQGSNQNISINQTVLDLYGLIGQVSKVNLENSHVILITDQNHAVPVEFLRTGVRTVLYGTGDMNSLSLPEIPQSADIKVGDTLITSGFGGVFPRGLKVASLSEIHDSQGDRSFQQAYAKPSANLNNLKQVLLVWEDSNHSESSEDATQ